MIPKGTPEWLYLWYLLTMYYPKVVDMVKNSLICQACGCTATISMQCDKQMHNVSIDWEEFFNCWTWKDFAIVWNTPWDFHCFNKENSIIKISTKLSETKKMRHGIKALMRIANQSAKPPYKERRLCVKCGSKLSKNARFCKSCGTRVELPTIQAPMIQQAEKRISFFCQLDNEKHPAMDSAFQCELCARYVCDSCYRDMNMVGLSSCSYCGGSLIQIQWNWITILHWSPQPIYHIFQPLQWILLERLNRIYYIS